MILILFLFLEGVVIMACSCKKHLGWKKFCFLLLALFMGQAEIQARKIDAEQARRQAYAFWNKRMPRKGKASCRRAITGKSSDKEAYYVFNNEEGGFVIIAGDDAVSPVLGYTLTGAFNKDSIPDGLKDLLASYEKQINAVCEKQNPYSISTSSFTGERLLNTAKWNQGDPYNKYTPCNYWTGCVATAMAIIMRHHEWPSSGKGKHSYMWQGQRLTANFNHVYNWSSMPKKYSLLNVEKFDSVARLMYELGVSVEMNYAEDGSVASLYSAVSSMQQYFQYSRYAACVQYDNYEDREWKEKIRAEIDANRPVLYIADDEYRNTGHAFVIDGYKDDEFSVNWGWGGYADGFYSIGSLNPGNAAYNVDQWAVINLKPSGQEHVASLCMKKCRDAFCGMNMSVPNVKARTHFYVWLGNLTSRPVSGAFNGDVAIALVGRDGGIKEIVGSYHLTGFKKNYSYSSFLLDCVSNVDAVAGDSLAVVALEDGESSYVESMDEEGRTVRLPATGFVPKTFEIEKDLGDGATFVEISSPNNSYGRNFYNGKPLQGTTYRFDIKTDDSVAKSFVELDGALVNKVDESFSSSASTAHYVITTAYKSVHRIKVRTFKEHSEKTLDVKVLTPGDIERQLRALDVDFYDYSNIRIRGKVNARDIFALNKFPFCQIDMRDCEVVAYGTYPSNTIPESAFFGNCHLQHFMMPMTIEEIGRAAFVESGIVEITIPESVVKFGVYSFYNCKKLADVTLCHSVPPTLYIDYSVFARRENGIYRTLHVPAGCKKKYEEDPYAGEILRFFDAIVEDAHTGIRGVIPTHGSVGAVYDLSGARIVNAEKHRGIVIRGRKKYLDGIGR